jgi:hypothetical protein
MIDVSIGFTFDKEQVAGDFEGQHYDYKQTNIFLNHLAAPIPAGRCPGPICGLGYDSKPKADTITLDVSTVKDCPICKQVIDIGLHEASKRLVLSYGMDVLNVLKGIKPEPTKIPQTSLDEEFTQAFTELKKYLQK